MSVTASASPRSGRGLAALGILVSVVAVGGVVWWALGQEPPQLPTTAGELSALAGAVLIYFLSCAVRAERWLVLMRRNGAAPRRADMYGLTAVGFMGNNVLPARAGDALRVVFAAPRAATDRRTVIGTLLAERLLDVIVLSGLFLILVFGLLQGIGVPGGGRVALGLALVLAAVGVLFGAWWALHRFDRLSRARDFITPMMVATARLRGRHGAEVLGMTVLIWGLEVLVWWAVGIASGLDASLLEAGFLLALSSLFVLVPSGPGYAGTLDAALVVGTQAIGRSASAALSYLILLRFVLMVPITLAGLVVLVARYGGRRALAAARA